MIHRSRLEPVGVPEVPVSLFAMRHAAARADAPALVDGLTGRTLSYGALLEGVQALAGGLAARGFAKGSVLAIMAPNAPEYALAFHGAAWAGGAVTTVNPTYTVSEVRHQLQDSGARILLTAAACAETAREAAVGTAVEAVFSVDPCEGLPSLEALRGEPMTQHAAVTGDDLVALPYSSGTTGLSKGVMLTHRNLVANLVQTEVVLPIAQGEAVLSFLPFFHIYGMQVLMNGGLAAGGTVITMPRFDLEVFLSRLQKHAVRRAFVVPPVVLALAKHPLVDKFDLSSLRQVFSGAAPLGAELAEECGRRLGCEVVQGYGMTELSPVSHATREGDFKPGTIGTLLPSTEARIVDPATGQDQGIDAAGELWIRGPQVMKGYLHNAEATAETIDDQGWLRTGDVALVDADGHFTIVDRLKELIKYKGFQVPPAELEALLVSHPDIADAAVIGVPDPEAGELPKAFVVPRAGAELSEEAVKAFVAGQVAHYKQLRLVELVQEIPKSASGKILRRVLRERR